MGKGTGRKRGALQGLGSRIELGNGGEGVPPSEREVQLGKRTGGKRGAPFGNANRLKHGRYSARRIRRRSEVNALLRGCRNLTRRIEMMGWSRKALRMKRARIASAQIVIPGDHCAQSARCEGVRSGSVRTPNFRPVSAARKLGSLPSTRARARASPGMTMRGRG